jgi:hypothetical protein
MGRVQWVVFGILLLANVGSSETRPRIPTLQDLATVWIGGVPGGMLEYFRLELELDGGARLKSDDI